MKSVVVAGGAGFVGSHLVDRLLARPDIECLVVVDNLWSGQLANLAHIQDPRLFFEFCDVEAFRSDRTFDEVFHLASPASPPWYMQDPERTISANLLGAMRLRESLKPGGRFCYTSSSEVYGDPLVSPQTVCSQRVLLKRIGGGVGANLKSEAIGQEIAREQGQYPLKCPLMTQGGHEAVPELRLSVRWAART
jgi:nucleoside-diphosphate-sugar epimerase